MNVALNVIVVSIWVEIAMLPVLYGNVRVTYHLDQGVLPGLALLSLL